jgi:SM-20-related protein
MPNPKFFRAAGLFLQEEFLFAQQCDAIREEMAASQQSNAALARQGVAGLVVDPYVRKTRLVKVSKDTRLKMHEALTNLLPTLSAHFTVTLTGIQPTDFLAYREGDFFARHMDVSKSTDRVEARRKVSVIVFLNDQSEAPCDGAYTGGSLVFYGLLPPPFEILGHPLAGKRGSLVAFRPDMAHEVRPVTRGIRYTVVSWCE